MTYFIDHQFALREHPGGPLAPLLKDIVQMLRERRYARATIQYHLQRIARFSEWLGQQDIELCRLSTAHMEQYLQSVDGRAYTDARSALTHLADCLRCEGIDIAQPVASEPTPAERCIADYGTYLSAQRGLAGTTVEHYVRHVGEFLRHRFGSGEVDLSVLQVADVEGFIRQQAGLRGKATMKAITRGLRSFLRYVRLCDDTMPDLAARVPTVADWPKTSVPRAITADQTDRLLASVERTTATGRRDHAILLLLARLGLRSQEVAFLNLEDIDWHSATLTVTLKGGNRGMYPLTAEIGEAIRDYLLNGRPPSDDRRLFLYSRAPFRGFASSSGIYAIVRSRIERAGIDAPTRGAHQFRHGLACRMLHEGASLEEIGDLLNHRHPDSTMIYAKVDMSAMRPLSLPWPGVRP